MAITLKAYYDGSGRLKTDSEYLTLAGYVGTPAAWEYFEAQWISILNIHGLDYLHMREATAFDSAWAREHEWTRPKLNSLLIHLQNQCFGDTGWGEFRDAFFGVSCTINLGDHQRALIERPRLKDPATICVDVVIYNSLRGLPVDEDKPPLYKSGEMEVFFDKGEPFFNKIDRLWRKKKRSNLLDFIVTLGQVDDSKRVPGAQAADFLAWNVNKRHVSGEFWYELVGMSAPAERVYFDYQTLIDGYNGIEISE